MFVAVNVSDIARHNANISHECIKEFADYTRTLYNRGKTAQQAVDIMNKIWESEIKDFNNFGAMPPTE